MAATDQRSVCAPRWSPAQRAESAWRLRRCCLPLASVAIVDKDADALRAAASKLTSDRVLALVQDLAHPMRRESR